MPVGFADGLSCLLVLPSAGCRVESISLNIEAVNTHRERPEVSVAFPEPSLGVPLLSPTVSWQQGCLGWAWGDCSPRCSECCWRTGASDGFLLCKYVPVEGFPREKDCCMCLLPTVFVQIKAGPGKAPPWSLNFTCVVIRSPEWGTEPGMEKVTSPRSPNWLAEPGLNALPYICLCVFGFGFFSN